MKASIYFALCIALLSAAFVAGQSSVACGQFFCGPGTGCCCDPNLGCLCYNTNNAVCTHIIGGPGTQKLCGIRDNACLDVVQGTVCFDKNSHICTPVQGVSGSFWRVCPVGTAACGSAATCFQTSLYKCCAGTICQIGQPNCNC